MTHTCFRQASGRAAGGPSRICWRLTRPCALTPRQMMLSYAVVVVISAMVAAFFGWHGYWVIPVWCLLQVIAAGVMYGIYLVHAIDGEHITLSPQGELSVEVVRGLATRRHRMPLAWARVERGGRLKEQVWLCCSDRRVEVATQLRPTDRRRLEQELRQTLRDMQERTLAPRIFADIADAEPPHTSTVLA